MSDLRNGDSSLSEDFDCKHCGALVYWGPHYDAKGNFDRRLFTRATYRLHDCRVQPDASAFDVVPE